MELNYLAAQRCNGYHTWLTTGMYWVQIPGWVKTKWVCLLKRCNPCSPDSKIGTGVSRGFVTLQSQ